MGDLTPEFKCGDHVRIMQTDDMEACGLGSGRGIIIRLKRYPGAHLRYGATMARIILDDGQLQVAVETDNLMAVEPDGGAQ